MVRLRTVTCRPVSFERKHAVSVGTFIYCLARFSCPLLLFVFLQGALMSYGADPEQETTSHALDLRFETTTYVLNLEKQGLQDNTFTNGIGIDTTLIGDFASATLHRRLLRNLDATLGVFANIPFGYTKEVYEILPIARLDYRPVEQVSATAGTVYVPHRLYFDAVFDNANWFVRPIEQGAQITTDLEFYRQDAFINWRQVYGESMVNRFDAGYAGQLRAGPVRFNAQMHWIENGQALMKLNRAFNTRLNVTTAWGPELVLEPSRLFNMPEWWGEIGVRFTAFNTYNEPDQGVGPVTRGRGYETEIWADFAGWRPRLGFWNSSGFLSQQGDPEFVVASFTELGLSKTISLGPDASIEFGGQVRRMNNFESGQGIKWVNQEYFVFNWNWDTSRADLLGDLLSSPKPKPDGSSGNPSERRFRPLLDTFTYVYNLGYSGLNNVNGRPVADATYAGEYLTPVLRYRPMGSLTLDAGFFAGLPVGSTQTFHTVQPILSAEWEMLPQVSFVAGTLYRNHPLLDAMFDDATLFARPIEQGFQLLIDLPGYQQDLFINWNQIETSSEPEQFDVGYAGRLSKGWLGLNGQVYWNHSGGAQFSESRSITTPGAPRNRSASNNFQAAIGPDVIIQPGNYVPGLSWIREIEILATYLYDQFEPIDITQSITRGRGYFLSTGADIAGWRPYVNFWRGENYVTLRGDPAYFAGNFTEIGLLKDVSLPGGFTLRFGGFGRTIDGRVNHGEYALLNWSWDEAPWRGSCLRPTLLHPREQSCVRAR